MRRLLVCVVLLVACKGSKSQGTSPGSGTATAPSGSAPVAPVAVDAPAAGSSGSGSATQSATRPKEVADLEATLVALTGEPESDARSKKTCGQVMELHKKVHAVSLARPAAVDAAAWDAAIAKMASDITDGLAINCKDDPPDDSVDLPKLYTDFQALLALLPK